MQIQNQIKNNREKWENIIKEFKLWNGSEGVQNKANIVVLSCLLRVSCFVQYRKKTFSLDLMINPSLTKLVRLT